MSNHRQYLDRYRLRAILVGALRLGESNDPAGDARARVAGGLAELVAADAEVVGVRVHHQRAPDYAVRSRQGDLRVLDANLQQDMVTNILVCTGI